MLLKVAMLFFITIFVASGRQIYKQITFIGKQNRRKIGLYFSNLPVLIENTTTERREHLYHLAVKKKGELISLG